MRTLILAKDDDTQHPAVTALARLGVDHAVCHTVASACDLLRNERCTGALMDASFGVTAVRRLIQANLDLAVVVVGDRPDYARAEDFLENGASDYLCNTFDVADVVRSLRFAEARVKGQTHRTARSRRLLGQYNLMQRFFQLAAEPGLERVERFQRALQLGCELFDCDTGIVSRIKGKDYTVEYAWGKALALSRGQVLELPTTMCSAMLETGSPLAVANIEQSAYRHHPAAAGGYRAYIGMPIHVGGEVYGSVCFTRKKARGEFETATDIAFLRSVGPWIGTMMQQAVTEEALEQRARRDELTGLVNRQGFMPSLDEALAESSMSGVPMSLLYVDLDKFKRVNEMQGYHAGDELLRRVAEALKDCLDPTDTVARFAGDEFVALLPGQSAVASERVAERVSIRLGSLDSDGHTQVSIGVAVSDGTESPDELIEVAEGAMVRARKTTRRIRIAHLPGHSAAAIV